MAKVRVPKAVLDGLEAVRTSGLTNMLDRPVVARLASEFGFERAARWVETHNVLDFAQRDVFFLTPDAGSCRTARRTPVGVEPSLGRPATVARAQRTERRSPCPARPH